MTTTQDHNLFGTFRSRIENPDAPFLYFSDTHILTYADMLQRSAQYANALVSLGVKPGDRVAAQVEKSTDALLLYLGCLRAGSVFLPLNMGYKDKELAYFITDAEPALVACTSARKNAIEEIVTASGSGRVETFDQGGGGSLIEIADGSGTDFKDLHRDADDLAAILYTSGTTGRSKGAMLTHKNLSSNAQALVDAWQFTNTDVLLHALPIFHTHGLFVATNTVLSSGSSMIFQIKFEVERVLATLPLATCMMGVPTFYSRLLASKELTSELVSHIRVFISGSAPLSPETHKKFEQQTGHAILERYGMIETSMNTSNPFDGERRASTVGFPLPDIEIRIVDIESGAKLDTNEVGVIEVRGPNVFKGYWRMPEKTKEEFRDDGFFISGDLGFIDERGYISIVGRNKDLIISGGFNIYPAEVENALDAISGISESAVIGVPHPDFGEGVTAVVVPEGECPLATEDIRATLERDLANYKLPKRVFFVDALPRNKMGKIQKNQLREQFHAAYQA